MCKYYDIVAKIAKIRNASFGFDVNNLCFIQYFPQELQRDTQAIVPGEINIYR